MAELAAENVPVLVKRPVAFRVKRADESGDWRIFNDEQQAREEADQTDADMQALYVRDGTVITQDRAAVAAEVMEQCARVADAMADAQEATNKKYPDHAKAYDAWVRAVDNYRDVAKTIREIASGLHTADNSRFDQPSH